jgi:hypothetical protein
VICGRRFPADCADRRRLKRYENNKDHYNSSSFIGPGAICNVTGRNSDPRMEHPFRQFLGRSCNNFRRKVVKYKSTAAFPRPVDGPLSEEATKVIENKLVTPVEKMNEE